MTQPKPTPEQQLTHVKVKLADVVLANMALQEQLAATTQALQESQALLEQHKAVDTDQKQKGK
jgi:hypothetical protein